MRKSLVVFTFCCLLCNITNAQNLINRVPSNASFVVKYAGENFSKAIPLEKLDSYNLIKYDFFKALHIDTLTSLKNIGINFTEDFFQYVVTEDTCVSFVTLLSIKNEAQFLKLLKANYSPSKKIVKKKGYSYLPISETTYAAWNKNSAVIINSSYQNRKDYYSSYYNFETVTVDTAIAIEDYVIEAPVPDTTEIIPEEKVEEMAEAEEKIEEMKEGGEDEIIIDNSAWRITDSINNLKRELWEQQQDMIAKNQQKTASEKIIATFFMDNISSIKNDLSYKKIIDPAAHISVWLNTETLFSQYQDYFNRDMYSPWRQGPVFSADTSNGFKSSANMYFEKDKLRIEQKTYSEDPKMNEYMLNVMNSKQNSGLVNYINPNNIGYFSMSINTEAAANYYYVQMKKYMSNMSYMKEYGDLVDIYIDLLEIIIDEKAIAELLTGNYLFVMHDLKPQIVDYTDYVYDEEYNRTEVKKTRKELSPDFSFIVETKKEAFMKKIANLPLKYAEKEHFNYKEKGGYYELAFDTGKYPINSLYFMIKDGKVIVTTSKEVITMTIANSSFATDAETKNTILNNNYALQLNSKRLIEKLETQFSTDITKKVNEYLVHNVGDVKMQSLVKDGMIQGTTTMNITGNHGNSLEFFFNVIESINAIIDKDKQEKEKKIY